MQQTHTHTQEKKETFEDFLDFLFSSDFFCEQFYLQFLFRKRLHSSC